MDVRVLVLTSMVVSVIHLTLLPSGARPIPFAALDYEEVPAARDLECDAYGRCLEFVANARWVGFSCRQCPFNKKEFDLLLALTRFESLQRGVIALPGHIQG